MYDVDHGEVGIERIEQAGGLDHAVEDAAEPVPCRDVGPVVAVGEAPGYALAEELGQRLGRRQHVGIAERERAAATPLRQLVEDLPEGVENGHGQRHGTRPPSMFMD